jgi:ribosomal protein S18 acetylase RimI-like enzyme
MIRKYISSDKEQLMEVFQANVPTYFDPKEATLFSTYLGKQSDTYWTVVLEDKVVGGIGYYFDEEDRSGQITWIFFDPEYSGRGLGKQAMKHCMDILESNPNLERMVVRTSQLAYRFFEKFGFQLQFSEKDYWGRGLDLYYMEKRP